jgi:hypothetical protein
LTGERHFADLRRSISDAIETQNHADVLCDKLSC